MARLEPSEWNGILSYVLRNHPNLARPWFDQLACGDLEHGVLEINCANLPQQRYLGEHCVRAFSEAAQALTGRLISAQFFIRESPSRNGAAPPPGFVNGPEHIRLNPEYAFDHFVIGPCNRLAHAACVAISESPGETYNPLFLHGNVGLGKTHLMQAVCHNAAKHNPRVEILYLSCETFVNHFIEAVEHGALHDFRFRYRHVDILLIDDIQFLAGRERTQEEFFHTFNTLYQSRKQIVLSADSSPREIPSLENRLISRFNWGLVARIDAPCMETRMAIVRKKARLRNIALPEDVIQYIATRVDSNTRELEGAITCVDALSQQLGQPIDLRTARDALGDLPTTNPRLISIPQILEVVVHHFNVKKSDVQGRRRQKSIAFPRHVCMHLARELTSHSLEEIGSYFGGRDHTTVMHATRLISRLRENDAELSATLEHLKSQLVNNTAP